MIKKYKKNMVYYLLYFDIVGNWKDCANLESIKKAHILKNDELEISLHTLRLKDNL
ncbi:MAG: hypothetical protein SO040_06755 [Catenibacterium mitsuokai]|uniref:hypothetical protein n=1 Tax=Catenibacterium mitsuokai TaxID=100886 RepID=UPI002A7FA3EE|nr:hypothetical protein [Catenibacterium mitsuokai]MDY3676612.1 hypothetical protein [Catenibacterium mitsuokai]